MRRWPSVPIGEFMTLREADVVVHPSTLYHFAGVYCFGKGLLKGEKKTGLEISYKRLTSLNEDNFVYPKLMAWEGAFAVVPALFEGLVVSTEFPVFEIDKSLVMPSYIASYFRMPSVWAAIAGSSTGTNVRRRRLNPSDFLRSKLPLPPIDEQRRLMAHLEDLSARVQTAQNEAEEVRRQTQDLLLSVYVRLKQGAPISRLGDVAPLTRRPATVTPLQDYPQVSVRSFGRGTFQNPPLRGSDITWEKPHQVKAGDILVSNIKAWEGAIAVAKEEDDGRYGSHRYLTYVPILGIATARFLCFHLLTPEGLHHVGEASPGSADRNRTTSAKALLDIPVPLPSYEQQVWFDQIYDKIKEVRRLQALTTEEREALLSAILNRGFHGKL